MSEQNTPNTENMNRRVELPAREGARITREKILMAESAIGARYLGESPNGKAIESPFFETTHGVFETVGQAERFAESKIRGTRWLVADRVTRDGGKPTYDYITKPRHPRRFED